uniref:Uncharacterized protein n=1 Tax=viral metagenome TaxID=1070528 RepID=A0A6C0CAC9_9ZZZZ
MNDFAVENMTLFKINCIEYALHNHIIKTISIFDVLDDCNINSSLEHVLHNRALKNDSEPLEINWNISSENVVTVLHIINGKCYDLIDPNGELSNHLEIIAFMKYLGVSQDIMVRVVSKIVNGSVYDFIGKCSNIVYDDNMMFIFDNFHRWNLTDRQISTYDTLGNLKHFIQRLTVTHFPAKFQKRIIKKMVRINITSYVYDYVHSNTSEIIKDICEPFDCAIDTNLIVSKMRKHIGLEKVVDLKRYVEQVYDDLSEHIAESLISRNI